jgi:preprotein translocase subunit SecG
MLHSIVLVFHVLACLMIVGLVLLQRGKGAEAGTGFGAGASGTVFGARGSANFLSRATGILTALFFASSLALAYLSTQRTTTTPSLLGAPAPQTQAAPVAPPQPVPAEPAGDVPDVSADLPDVQSDVSGDAPPATGEPN